MDSGDNDVINVGLLIVTKAPLWAVGGEGVLIVGESVHVY